jgi:hypothetical protein
MTLCGTAFPQKISDFEVDDKGVITRYNGFDVNVVIPAEISGKKITAIGMEVFQKSELTGVTIPDSVTSIGNSAFDNNKLTDVTIPGSVMSIGYEAFRGNQLARVTIGNGVTSIEGSAFAENKLISITIPGSVKTVGTGAFNGNPALGVIVLSEGVETVSAVAFANTNCTRVSLPSTARSIGDYAFDTKGKPSFTLAANINADFSSYPMFYSYIANDRKAGTYAFDAKHVPKNAEDYEYYETQYGAVLTAYTGNSTRVRIPARIGGVEVKALYGTSDWNGFTGIFSLKSLVAIQIPEGITYIGQRTFISNQLVSVTIPNSVTYIGDEAFTRNLLASVIIGSNASLGAGNFASIDNDFDRLYNNGGKVAGTYIRDAQGGWARGQ